MQLHPGEHNCLDRGEAERAAFLLKKLFESPLPEPKSTASDDRLGPMPLIDDPLGAVKQPISPYDRDVEVYAVDGGSSIPAGGGNIELIAWRAGMCRFRGRKRLGEYCPQPQILPYNRLEPLPILQERLISSPIPFQSSESSVRPVDELRWLEEWRLIDRIIEEADNECLLLIDGSLRANPSFCIDRQKAILQKAAERKAHVVAVTKHTLVSSRQALPIDIDEKERPENKSDRGAWYQKISRSIDAESGWLGNIYRCRLHPGANKYFLVHLNRFDSSDEATIFSWLASISDDIEFAGYPYPLAAAHRLARIDSLTRRELTESIGRALEGLGFSPALWQHLAGDMHERLNANLADMKGTSHG